MSLVTLGCSPDRPQRPDPLGKTTPPPRRISGVPYRGIVGLGSSPCHNQDGESWEGFEVSD